MVFLLIHVIIIILGSRYQEEKKLSAHDKNVSTVATGMSGGVIKTFSDSGDIDRCWIITYDFQ